MGSERPPESSGADELSRAEIRRLAKQLLTHLQPIYDEVSRAGDAAIRSMSDATSRTRDLRIGARLRATTIDQLAAGQKIRTAGVKNLRARGIGTAADVCARTPEELAETSGIGAEGARKLIGRAKQLAKTRLEDLRLPAAPDLWTGADETLARALQFWHTAAELVAGPSASLLDEIVADLHSALRDTAWYRWMFSSGRSRRSVKQRFGLLQPKAGEFSASDELQDLQTRLRDLRHHEGVPVDRSYWQRHSAELQAELEEFQARFGDEDARSALSYSLGHSSGLSGDLVDRMKRLDLDLSLVRRKLRRYQEQGVRFAVCVGGGLLGDDMGLGKTTQALAGIGHGIATEGQPRHVVVCPASLLTNWEEEIKSVLDGVKVWKFHGPTRDGNLKAWEQEGGVLLTSYHLKPLVERIDAKFGFLVVDEAHSVKDPTTQRTKLVKELTSRAERVLLMTGTPLINEAADMINLLAIVDPSVALTLGQRFGQADDVLQDADAFRHALSGHYLRRNQHEVLGELPPLTLVDVPVELTSSEVHLYKTAVIGGHLARMRIAASVARGTSSSKMEALSTIVEEARSSARKVLVFSEFVDVLDTAHELIGADAYVVHGGVSDTEAIRREAEFLDRSGFAALVYQIRKGGVGKNFQEASVVVLMEPQFTPAAERQAIGRAHRMRQTEHVVCHRLVALGTVDERLVELVDLKSALVNELANDSDLAAALGRRREKNVTEAQLVDEERRRLGVGSAETRGVTRDLADQEGAPTIASDVIPGPSADE